MEFKDIASLFISGLAFVLSAIATFISVVRGKYEQQRTVRNQLSDALNRIAAVNIENAKLRHDTARIDPGYFQEVSAMLNQQQTSLLNQAMYLTDQIPRLVTAVDYNTIASANFNAGDMRLAEEFYKRAITVSPNNYYRSLATRSYAAFLFTQRRFEEGRAQFRQAISLITSADSGSRYTNGFTYQMWAWHELNGAGVRTAAEQLFESARGEFKGIDNDFNREQALKTLEGALPTLVKPPALGPLSALAAAFPKAGG